MRASRLFSSVFLLALVVGSVFAYTQKQQIYDWAQLRDYQTPAAISQLASDDTMTPYAQHLFYVNHPDLTTDKSYFNQQCGDKEQTIVLGCYQSNQRGIHLYAITDPRLNGVEQVTAAHEMLHATYDRLSAKDRANVDSMLEDYYKNDLHDQRILDSINLYKKIEPNDVVNEMHSVFGTEIANLPAPLENYYKRYFGDRQKIAQYAANYQDAFTSLQNQVSTDDAQLATMKPQIDNLTTEVDTEQRNLAAQKSQLDSERDTNDIAKYNAGVNTYNSAVNTYNTLVASLKSLISQYNMLVNQRNTIAVQENQLSQAIDSQAAPVSAQ